MKVETCCYSGYKIYPGHGKRAVKVDGKVQIFLNAKSAKGTALKRNPREITWTVLYRRKNRKGVHGEESHLKKKTRKVAQTLTRGIGNLTLDALLAKRNQKPEFRKAQREQAIKEAKEAAAKKKTANKEKKAAQPKVVQQKAAKSVKTAAPRVGGKR
ncbi:unnamed protein product, partial [Mesorhabditis belari]|uniref:Large ribosomal subunit protein eL24 n=1 Tax=Mesorhabditis belari TaxID=2138241 RepID=A0AAF3F303_9BILA